MTRALIVRRATPGLTVQDLGRPGYLTFGVSRGGAADRIALAEGAALLGQKPDLATLEMAAMGGDFEATEATRIALTGAPMRATIDGERIAWNASHLLKAGALLSIGAAESGVYGYLSVGGGFETPEILGSKSAHLATGLGTSHGTGEALPIGCDTGGETNRTLPAENRFAGGMVRVVPSMQTHLFDAKQIARFEATVFHRDVRSNRMGARMTSDGEGFSPTGGLSILSEVIMPGDIQITGDGTPFVLMSESQTVGGYPRIGTILPTDLPRVAQAPAKADLRFAFVTLEDALEIEARTAKMLQSLPRMVTALVREPHAIRDLLSYQLISGVTAGSD